MCVCVCVYKRGRGTAHLNVFPDSVGKVKVYGAHDPLHKINQPKASRLVEDEVNWAKAHLYNWTGDWGRGGEERGGWMCMKMVMSGGVE